MCVLRKQNSNNKATYLVMSTLP